MHHEKYSWEIFHLLKKIEIDYMKYELLTIYGTLCQPMLDELENGSWGNTQYTYIAGPF